MKSKLETFNNIDYLAFRPNSMPNPLNLPVIQKGSRDKANAWTWNGSLEKPTLRPSVRTKYLDENNEWVEIHFWLTDGVCQCLSDCTDGNSGKNIELINVENLFR